MKGITKYPYGPMPSYPGLQNRDAILWDSFISKNPNFFSEVSYNVRVGEGRDYSNLFSEKIIDMAKKLTKHRIDVIGFRNDDIWICECKPYCMLSGMGQLIGYQYLFMEKNKTTNVPHMAYIYHYGHPDVIRVCLALQIHLYQLKPTSVSDVIPL
jgi:hypothetical protein